MKKVKYLLLFLFLIPTVVLAEPIHLTQAAIEECFANEGVYNETYKITFKLETFVSGFFFSGGEYILDEDIDVHSAHIASENNALVLNMNGHTITSALPKYYTTSRNVYLISPVGCFDSACDITINGPGLIDNSGLTNNSILMEAGKIKVNNVDLIGNVRSNYRNNPDDILININTSNINGRFELYNSTATFKNTKFNTTKSSENQCLGCKLNLDNADVGYEDFTATSHVYGIYITDSFGYIPEVSISNSTIRANGSAYPILLSKGKISIDNSYLYSQKGSAFFSASSDNEVTIWDTHLKTIEPYPDYRRVLILSNYNSFTDQDEALKSIIPDDYMYYADPVFGTESAGRFYLDNSDIWIIKKQDNYNTDELIYKIPEDNDVIINVSGNKALLLDLRIAGELIPTSNYELLDNNNGIVSIKLNNDYLKTLNVDNYDVEVRFANGSATTVLNVIDNTPEVKGVETNNPQTGDNIIELLMLLSISLMGLTVIKLNYKKSFK